MDTGVHVFLPCRRGSERVPRKNIKPFAGFAHGLVELKLTQLLRTPEVASVVLSTNDLEILDYASSLGESRIVLHERIDELGSSSTSTDALVDHAVQLIPEGHILWTHVTSPFFSAVHYGQAIRDYFDRMGEGYDSLMSVSKVHGFLWNEREPVNYDRSIEKWPRTQSIKPLYEVNSALFLNSADNYRQHGDRIGRRPYLWETSRTAAFDVDWPDDFELAEMIAASNPIV